MMNCSLCNNELERSTISEYPPRIPELCCRYFHSSLTQEILSRQSNQEDLQFCRKCFESVMELNDLNDQLEFNQKMISEFIFIRSLEILHRRGQVPGDRCDQNRPNDAKSGKQLIEFDVSALPTCEFRKINSEVIEETSSTEDYRNVRTSEDVGDEGFPDPFVFPPPADVNVDTMDVTYENVKVESNALGYIDESHENEAESKDANLIIKKTKQNSESIDDTETNVLNPIVKLQKLSFPSISQKDILMENKPNVMGGNKDVVQPICIETGFGGSLSLKLSGKKDNSILTKDSAAKTTVLKASAAKTTVSKASAAKTTVSKASTAKTTVTNASAAKSNSYLENHLTFHQSTNKTLKRPETNKEQQFPEVNTAIHSNNKSERIRKQLDTKNRQLNRQQTEEPIKCDVCSREFRLNNHLLSHKRVHKNGCRPFRCDICGVGFFQNDELIMHQSTHQGSKQRSYNCKTCGKVYSSIHALRTHSKLNHADKDKISHQCQVCDKGFSRPSHLKMHVRTHTGEKPYECEFCGKRFTIKSNLTVHRRSHTGKRPFKCDICDTEFTRKRSLVNHLRNRRRCNVTQ